MLKTIKKSFLAVVLAVATLFALTSCVITGGGQTTTDPTLDAQAALSEFTEQVTFANTAEVTTSFNLPAAGKKGSYQIPITWTSNNEAVIAITDLVEGGTTSATHKKASVTRPAFDAEDVTVTLTAEFSLTYTKNDGTSATLKETKTYNFTVLKETSEIAGGTLADIKADAAKFYFVDNAVKPGTSSAKELEFPVEFDATVTAVLGADGAGQFTVNDGTAGIYVYSNKTAVNVGDKVHVKGSITVYYGTLQVGANIEVTVLGTSDQTIEFKPATPGSINAMDTADGMYGGQALKVSGTLLFGKYNNGSSDSFWLEDAQTGSQIELYYKSFTAAEKEALKAYAGKYVEMDVVTYDTYSSSAPNDHRVFAIPSTVKEAAAPTVSDADKVAAAVAKANAASLKDVYYNGDAFAFPAIDVAEGVNIAWSLEPAALLVDGKLVITAAGTATLKAVITCGELTETVTLTINLDVEVPAVDTGDFKENTPYYIVATNGKGDLHFDGTLSSGRFNGKYTAAEAVKVYVEKADNGLYIYFLDGTTKTYIVMGDSSSGGAFTTDKASATVFEYNATVDTLVVAEDSNNRAFGVGATSTYDNFSAYDITGTYNWGKFVAADGTTEPEQPEQPTHTHTACPECGKCTAADCDGTDADKCQGHTPVEPEQPTWEVVTEFKENVAYKFGVVQGNLNNKLIYLTGNYKNTHYGESTDNIANAADVYVVAVEGGYNLKLVKADGTVLYINVVASGTYRNIKFQEAASSVWTFDTELNTFVTDIEGTKYYVGTYNTFDTISPSSIDKAATSFVGHLYGQVTEPETPVEPEQPAHTHTACPECGKCTAADCDGTDADKCQGHTPVEPEQPTWGVVTEFKENVAYKFGVVQGNLSNKLIYLTGNYKNTYYGESTDDVTKAADIYVVAVEGGYNLKLVKADGTVLYINLVASGTHINIKFQEAASSVWTFDAELNTFVTDIEGTKYYVGTYNTYDTISPSSIDKAATSFVGQLYGQTTGGNTPVEPEQPTHEHTLCPECGKCTAADCDGADTDKCAGHTPVEPEQPVVTGGKADLETLNGGKASGSYANSTSTNGWEVKNSAINGGKSTPNDVNPNFTCLGGDEVRAITLNGKVSAPGSITSPVLEGGISKLTFNYTNLFTDKQFSVTITIKNEAGEVVATKVLEWEKSGNKEDKYDNQTFVWELETAVSGKFIIEIVNNCPTQATGNKDRLTIWNIEWVGATDTPATPEQPEQPAHTHTACPTCGKCTAADCDGADADKCAGHPIEEPAVTNKTVAELIALTTEMDAKYTVTGKIVLWGNKLTSTDVAPGQYGNFVLEGEDGSKIVVYGATATASALTFNTTTGKYTYVNPKDFLTNELTSTIAVGDTVELVVVRTSYNSNPQLNAIVTKVTKAEPEVPAHEHTACPTCGLCTAEDCDGDATVKCQGHAPEEPEVKVLATFEFGANGGTTHVDGNDISAGKSYSDGNYTLTIKSCAKVYDGAKDAKGNSCLKFGTSKLVGSITFDVPENVSTVTIYVAQYKANATKISINGETYTVSTASNNGEYTAYTVDTTTVKTITLATVASNYRAMVNTIVYEGVEA